MRLQLSSLQVETQCAGKVVAIYSWEQSQLRCRLHSYIVPAKHQLANLQQLAIKLFPVEPRVEHREICSGVQNVI